MKKKYLAPQLAPSVTPRHGHGKLLPGGKPGHRGGSGRPPAKFKDWVREILESDETKSQIQRILRDADHPSFSTVLGKLLPYGYGSPSSAPIDHAPNVTIVDDL